jgi:hypothetical protein
MFMYCLCNIFYWHTHTHTHIYILYISISNTYLYEMLIDSVDHSYLGQQREQRCRRTLLAPLLVHPQQKYRKKMRHMRQGHPMTTQFDSILYHSVICVCRKIEHHLNLMVYHHFSNLFPTKWPFWSILTHFKGAVRWAARERERTTWRAPCSWSTLGGPCWQEVTILL